MKYWTKDELFSGEGLPNDVIVIAANILRLTEDLEAETGSCLLRIGAHIDDEEREDQNSFEVLLKLAPGVILPVNCAMCEDIDDDWEGDDVQGIIKDVEKAIDECGPQLDRLSDLLHLARVRARAAIGSWASSGVQCDLVDVRLAPFDWWSGQADPALIVLVHDIDGCTLQPSVEEVSVETLDLIEERLSDHRDAQEQARLAKGNLLQLGASGTVTQLALNAIAGFDDEAIVLRRFATESRFWLPDETCLIMRHGEVQANNGSTNRNIEFFGDRLAVLSFFMPAASLKEAIGRPVTEIVQHEFLTDDMIITAASSHYDDGRPYVALKLDMPIWLFCSVTGRKWRMPDPDGLTKTRDLLSTGSSVVPFTALRRKPS